MARKAQAAPAEAVKPPPPQGPVISIERPTAAEVEMASRILASRFGIDPDLSPRERYNALRKQIAVAHKPPKRECHWEVLRGYLRGERDALAAAFAAEALGLGIKEALRKAGEGWTAAGAPARERVPGEDDE